MRFIDEIPAAAVRVPTFNLAFLPRFAAMSEEAFVAFAQSKPLRKEFILAMGRTGFPQKDLDAALVRLRPTYERMDTEIAHSGGPWLLGRDLASTNLFMPRVRADRFVPPLNARKILPCAVLAEIGHAHDRRHDRDIRNPPASAGAVFSTHFNLTT